MKIVTTLLLSLFASSVLFAQSGKTVRVQTRANSTVENWTPYEAHTVDNLKGFKKKKEPARKQKGPASQKVKPQL